MRKLGNGLRLGYLDLSPWGKCAVSDQPTSEIHLLADICFVFKSLT